MDYVSKTTKRGFEILQFHDDNNECCDIQRSSSAEEDKIWIGIHDPHPIILASKTEKGGTGWVDYPIPEDVLISHRMHLTRKQSISLALKLLRFGLFNKIR